MLFRSIYKKITGNEAILISVIGLFAIINGALIQLIMASRVVYGLSCKNWLPKIFSDISPLTNTPIKATLFVGFISLFFTLFFDLITLAELTSTLLLIIFTLINISLIFIKRKNPISEGIYTVPLWVPWCAIFLNVGLIFIKINY